jgi:hypothetical protein
MRDNLFLKSMYQQWCNGNSECFRRWYDFVDMAAKHNCISAELMLEELKKYSWFYWGDK